MSKQPPKYPDFKKRFCSLFNEGETQEEFGSRVGITRNTVAQYYNGHRMPDSITLREICARCNVSADWLLGLSEVKKPDADLQAVSAFMGLSPASIEAISDSDQKKTLDRVLSDPETRRKFFVMLFYIHQAMKGAVLDISKLTTEAFVYGKFCVHEAGDCAEDIAKHFAGQGE